MTMKNHTKIEEELTCHFKIDMRNLTNFDPITQKFPKFAFQMGYRGVIFHDTEKWCKIWQKTDLWFEIWHKEFGKFSPQHLKLSKLGLWWGSFVQSRKCMSLKFTEELCVMTMKNDAKFEEELFVVSKFTWGIWRILTGALEYLKKLLFNWFLWPKYIMFELKKWRRVMLDGNEDYAYALWLMLSKMTW